jgi:hypothetical protein
VDIEAVGDGQAEHRELLRQIGEGIRHLRRQGGGHQLHVEQEHLVPDVQKSPPDRAVLAQAAKAFVQGQDLQ